VGSAAERRDLWDRAGVLVDDLVSRVLVLNLPAEGEGLGEWPIGHGAAFALIPGSGPWRYCADCVAAPANGWCWSRSAASPA
jgi:hypothetical protein